MDFHLQPLGTACRVTGRPFEAGDRVVSFLTREEGKVELGRHDVSEAEAGAFAAPGTVVCRWVHVFKPRAPGDNADRALRLTAENLFLALAESADPTPENARLLQFLALMLERKRVVKPRGRTPDGRHQLVEHVRTKQTFSLPAGDLTPEFFVQVQAQLSVLVGEPKPAPGGGSDPSGGSGSG
jgi:hypothetical protein